MRNKKAFKKSMRYQHCYLFTPGSHGSPVRMPCLRESRVLLSEVCQQFLSWLLATDLVYKECTIQAWGSCTPYTFETQTTLIFQLFQIRIFIAIRKIPEITLDAGRKVIENTRTKSAIKWKETKKREKILHWNKQTNFSGWCLIVLSNFYNCNCK